MRQVSLPYKRTGRTFELNILVLVRILYWLLFQTLVNLLNDDLAFPTLAVISCSAPPVLLTIAPKYVKLSTSSTSFPSIDTGVWSLALYLMSFVFLMLVFIPIALLCLFRRSTFFWIRVFVLDSKARSSAKSMSSNTIVEFHNCIRLPARCCENVVAVLFTINNEYKAGGKILEDFVAGLCCWSQTNSRADFTLGMGICFKTVIT